MSTVPNLVFGQNTGSNAPTTQDSPNRPDWQQDVYQTSPTMAGLENAGWTFVRNNPYGTGGNDDGYGEVRVTIREVMDWLDSQDWTDPIWRQGGTAPDGTVITAPTPEPAPQPTQPEPAPQPTQPAEDDGNIFTDILGNINLGDGYGFNIPDIFGNSTLDPTAPFVPTPTTTPTNGSGGSNGGSTGGDTGTGVDLGNDGVPASDVVAGGQDSNLDDNNVDVNWLRLLGGGAAVGAASGLLSGMLNKDRSTTRTTDMVFSEMPELTKLTPTLLSPLYRS